MSRGIFCEHFFSNTKLVSNLSLDFEPRISKFWDFSDFFGRFVKIPFYVSGGSFWGSKFFITSCFSSCMFSKFGRKKFGAKTSFLIVRAVKRAFYMPRGVLRQRSFFFEKNSYSYNWFRNLTGNCWTFGEKGGRAVKSAHYAST